MKDRRNRGRGVTAAKIVAFGSVLAAMAIVGLLVPLRPAISALEKRTLTQFPDFTWRGLWDGSYFSQIDTWYADTYPLREELFSAQHAMEDRYGIRTTQIVGNGVQVADEIPDINAPAPTGVPNATPIPTATPVPDGTVHEIGEFNGNVYITNNSAYGTYYFSQSGADGYISTMNQVYQNIGDMVDMYVMNVPLSAAVMLDESVIEDMGCSDEGAAIDYIVSKLDPGIHVLDVYDTLREHNAEYIYFRTDHHWTQTGAYYAYREFCRQKGWTPHELEQFEMWTYEENNYLGSYYSGSNQSPQLAANPDTVYAYVPMATNNMTMTMRDYQTVDWHIINDMFDYPNSETYLIYVGGDQPFGHAHNDTLDDGSAILIVKDSYGNAFVPWFVDHYEDVYWIDFRYTWNNVSQMVQDYGVQDVIFEMATFNATSGLCNDLYLQIGS